MPKKTRRPPLPAGGVIVAGVVAASIAALWLEPPGSYLLGALGVIVAVIGAVDAIRKRQKSSSTPHG